MNRPLSKRNALERKEQENLKTLFTLMALSGNSDREIAKRLGISHTSLSRRKKKLEQEGYIKEYVPVPDFYKIGLEVVVLSLASTTDIVTPMQFSEADEVAHSHPELLCLLVDRGMTGTQWFAVTAHKDYDDFIKFSKMVDKELSLLHKLPSLEVHSFMFHTDKMWPKPFSYRNLGSIFQSAKPVNHIENNTFTKKITPVDA